MSMIPNPDDNTEKDDAIDPALQVEDTKLDEQVKVEEEKKEEDVTKLDLREPEHLEKFKNSYQARVAEVNDLSTQVEALTTELDNIRADQGKGVYLDTNVPLEDFNPQETLARMKEEEPEYYERIKESVIEANFWPSVGHKFESTLDRELNVNDETDSVVLTQMTSAWDVMSKRVVGVDGNTVYGILEWIAKSPDIKEELMARVQGRSTYNPEQPFQPQQTNPAQGSSYQIPQQYGQQQPAQVESVQSIATRLHLDPSEETHLTLIRDVQNNQRKMSEANNYANQVQQSSQTQITQLQQQIESLKNEKQKETTVSDEELTRQAESRLSALTASSLKDTIQREYGTAVTDKNRHLLGKLETLAQTRLKNDPTYSSAERTAVKWFKQAASAKNPQDRDRWDKKGIDALAVMVPIRLNAIDAEAQELLGPVKRRVEVAARRSTETRRPKEITQSGRVVSPRQDTAPAPSGDMASAKANILKRVHDSNLFQPRR